MDSGEWTTVSVEHDTSSKLGDIAESLGLTKASMYTLVADIAGHLFSDDRLVERAPPDMFGAQEMHIGCPVCGSWLSHIRLASAVPKEALDELPTDWSGDDVGLADDYHPVPSDGVFETCEFTCLDCHLTWPEYMLVATADRRDDYSVFMSGILGDCGGRVRKRELPEVNITIYAEAAILADSEWTPPLDAWLDQDVTAGRGEATGRIGDSITPLWKLMFATRLALEASGAGGVYRYRMIPGGASCGCEDDVGTHLHLAPIKSALDRGEEVDIDAASEAVCTTLTEAMAFDTGDTSEQLQAIVRSADPDSETGIGRVFDGRAERVLTAVPDERS